jgi:3''(2''),5''-bisphosphate nucleotidase (EC 3.1.3.7)
MERRYILNAIDAALQAGEKILSIYDDPASDFQVEKKADNSPLTIADRKAHETICRFWLIHLSLC